MKTGGASIAPTNWLPNIKVSVNHTSYCTFKVIHPVLWDHTIFFALSQSCWGNALRARLQGNMYVYPASKRHLWLWVLLLTRCQPPLIKLTFIWLNTSSTDLRDLLNTKHFTNTHSKATDRNLKSHCCLVCQKSLLNCVCVFCVHVRVSYNLYSISGIVMKIWWEQGVLVGSVSACMCVWTIESLLLEGRMLSWMGRALLGLSPTVSLYFHLAVGLWRHNYFNRAGKHNTHIWKVQEIS